jgi:hypothetical protein
VRSSIGVVPACPASPVKVSANRDCPAIAVTTPKGRSSASSTGPCSMCTSRYAFAPSNSGGSRAIPSIACSSAVNAPT